MELLERYLQAVGQYLPPRGKRDTLAELRANLLAQMEGREEELGRPLTQGEVADVLERHGHPVMVAARYLPQQHLIGPAWFPIYWFTLKKSFPFVVLAYLVSQAAAMIFQGWRGFNIAGAILHFPFVALTFWGVVTLGFAFFEYAQGKYFHKVDFQKGWNPNNLPPLETQGKKQPSLAGGAADVIVTALLIAWLLAVPYKPYLILGPGVGYLRGMPFGLSPEWHIFYWQIIGLMLVQLGLKTVMLFLHRARQWRKGADLVVHIVGILILTVMVQARSYLVPGTNVGAMSLHDLVAINSSINLAFKLVLAISVLKLLWDIWKMVTESHDAKPGRVPAL
ncbi:MAG TPA: hypothetical protein VIX42_08775 [Edaphobacter sp.]